MLKYTIFIIFFEIEINFKSDLKSVFKLKFLIKISKPHGILVMKERYGSRGNHQKFHLSPLLTKQL
jgi:hypothetical protein